MTKLIIKPKITSAADQARVPYRKFAYWECDGSGDPVTFTLRRNYGFNTTPTVSISSKRITLSSSGEFDLTGRAQSNRDFTINSTDISTIVLDFSDVTGTFSLWWEDYI